ncbi:MAG: Na+/H+ antiporter subunit E [Methylocella sp.]
MSAPEAEPQPRVRRAAAVRAAIFLAFWLMISGRDLAGLPIGAAAAAVAAWTSLRLLPPGASRLRPLALAQLTMRFLGQSVVAGTDVAWRALDPKLPLRPGFISYPLRVPAGEARNAFCALCSLLPGTLPTGTDGNGALLVHCLDVDQPVVANLAEDEALFVRALRHE